MSKYHYSSNNSGGVGTFGVVQIVFIILKLVKVIDWSWWVVFAPFWIELALVVLLSLYWWLFKKF